MNKIFFLGLVVGLILAMSSSVYAANLLTNGDFETGALGWFGDTAIPNWTTWGTDGWHHNDFNHTPSGSKAVKTWGDGTGIYQDFTATGGTPYDFAGSSYSKSDDAAVGWNGILKVEWYSDAGFTKLGENVIGTFVGGTDPVSTWKDVSATYAAPGSAILGRVVMNLTSTGPTHAGSIGWDDVSASPIPEPTSMLLLGSGLIGLFTVARRKK